VRAVSFILSIYKYCTLILNSRYFSRVWIILELLLAPSLLVPIGVCGFRAGNLTPSSLQSLSGWSWDKTAATWLPNIAQGTSFLTLDLRQALEQTWSSTDPRDKIFGILGLVKDNNNDVNMEPKLETDYSLPFVNTFIGICGHSLVILRNLSILVHATKARSMKPYPSWVSDWKSPSIWDGNQLVVPIDTLRGELKLLRRWREFDCELQRLHVICATAFEAHRGIYPNYETVPCFQPELKDLLKDNMPWYKSVSINPSTAALSIRMIHLLDLSKDLTLQLCERSKHISTFGIRSASCVLSFCTSHLQLEDIDITSPGTALFLLETSPLTPHLLFSMRKSDRQSHYTLMSCCQCFPFLIENSKKRNYDYTDDFRGCTDLPSFMFDSWPSYTRLFQLCSLSDKVGKLPEGLECSHYSTDYRLETTLLRLIFPSQATTNRNVLPVLQFLVDQSKKLSNLGMTFDKVLQNLYYVSL